METNLANSIELIDSVPLKFNLKDISSVSTQIISIPSSILIPGEIFKITLSKVSAVRKNILTFIFTCFSSGQLVCMLEFILREVSNLMKSIILLLNYFKLILFLLNQITEKIYKFQNPLSPATFA